MDETAKRDYLLTIIEAKDVRKLPTRPGLYVVALCAGKPALRTRPEKRQDARPTWGDICHPLSAHLQSDLSFQLKQNHRFSSDSLLGSINIKVDQLLDLCKDGEQPVLELLDSHGGLAGRLVVKLHERDHERDPLQVGRDAILAAQRELKEGRIGTSNRRRDPIDDDVAQEAASLLADALEQVMEKTKAIVDVVDEAAKLHPYANMAWIAVSSAYKVVRAQRDRDQRLEELVAAMESLYTFVDVTDGWKDKIRLLENIIIEIAQKTKECAKFIEEYASRGLAGRVMHQTISDTGAKISSLSGDLQTLQDKLNRVVTSYIAVVSNETRDNTYRLLLEHLKPASMDASTRQLCLDGTRVGVKTRLIDILSRQSDSLHCEVTWLIGLAGSGKSTLLHSIREHFSSSHRCGAYIIFNRSDPQNSQPRQVIPTLAYHLARFSPLFAAKLSEARPDILLGSLEAQFQALLVEPSKIVADLASHEPVILVIDGLDECGTEKSRRGLFETFSKYIPKLPPMFRILIASRDEKDIRSAFSQLNVERVLLSTDDDAATHDIAEYFRQRLMSIAKDSALPPDWPGPVAVEQLTRCAGGLFIWASTAVGFIEDGLPRGRLRTVLDLSTQGESLTKLDALYLATLDHQFEAFLPREFETLRRILGAIVVARERLTDEVLSKLLGLDLDDVRNILSRLRSLLQWSPGEVIIVLHASFPDFLHDRDRCNDTRWFIDESIYHHDLAIACFRIMRNHLRFNICGLNTSYLRNKAIDGIQNLVDQNITPHLLYGCQYWADHLPGVTASSDIARFPAEIRLFLEKQFLYWLEVFSLKHCFGAVPKILGVITEWCKKYSPDLTCDILDALKFVMMFGHPISQSVPHIYLSALPFSPSKPSLLRLWKQEYPNTLVVEAGRLEEWPAILQVFHGHRDIVTSVAFSPDGTRIASGSEDKTIQLWDAASGTAIGEPLEGHTDRVTSVAFSPDGTRIISRSEDKTIRQWDAESGTAMGERLQEHSEITSVAFSPDGTRIASLSEYENIRLWDAASGTAIGKPLRGHSGLVRSIAFCPDGTRIASGASDGTIRLWDAASGAAIGEPLRGHPAGCASVAFSPDGTRIVSRSGDNTIHLWDAASGVVIGKPLQQNSHMVVSVVLSPDGTRIVSLSDKTIRLWDVASSTAIEETLQGHSDITSVAFSPDGTRIASGSDDKTIRLWDAASGAAIGEPLRGHSDSVRSVAFSPDGTRIASGSDDKTIRLWDAASGAAIGEPLQGHSDNVTSVVFSLDGTCIVSSDVDNSIRLWDAASGTAIREPLQGHLFSPDGTRIVLESEDETIWLWDAASGTAIGELGPLGEVASIAFSPNGTQIVLGFEDKTIQVWDAVSGATIGEPLQGHTESVISVAFSPDGTRIASGSEDKTIRLWDAGSGTAVGGTLRGHSGHVTLIKFSPDGTRIVSCSGDGDNSIRVWDAASGAAIGELLQGHPRDITFIAFSPDSARIISCSRHMAICLWDAASGTAIGETLQGYSEDVTSVAFSPDGTCIVSYSKDKTIRLWDAVSGAAIGEPLQGHSQDITSISFSRDSTCHVSHTEDGTIQLWDAASSTASQGHSDRVTSIALSDEGTCIVSHSGDGTIRLWGLLLDILEPLQGCSEDITSIAFSPDGTRVVSHSGDRAIQLRDVASGAVIGDPLQGHSSSVTSVAFSPDGTWIVSGSKDKTIRLWDAASGTAIREPLQGHLAPVTSVAFSPNGMHIVSGSADKTIRLWDAASGTNTKEPPQDVSKLMSIAFSPDGTCIISCSVDGAIRVWDAASGTAVGEPLQAPISVSSAAFSPDGKPIAFHYTHYTVSTTPPLHYLEITSVTFSPDGTPIVSDYFNDATALGSAIRKPLPSPDFGFGTFGAISPDSTCIASKNTKTIVLWDAASNTVIGEPLQGHSNSVSSIAFSPNGDCIVSGSYDQTIRLWDTALGVAIKEPQGHPDWVTSVAFSADGTHIASGSRDKTIRLWDAALGTAIGEPLQGHLDSVTSIAFSPDGTRMVSGSYDKTIRLWDAPAIQLPHTSVIPKFTQFPGSPSNDSSTLPQSSHYTAMSMLLSCSPVSDDGWLTSPDGELLFWVPPGNQLGLLRPGTLKVFGAVETRIGFEHFAHGTEWAHCHL